MKHKTIEVRHCKIVPHRRVLTLRAAKGFHPLGIPKVVTLCQEHRVLLEIKIGL